MKKLIQCLIAGGMAAYSALAAPVEWNGHYYEYVTATGILWVDADANARAATFNGLAGHLATVTSQAENQFLATLIDGVPSYPGEAITELLREAWIGAYQSPAGEANPAAGWNWVNGEGPVGMLNGGPIYANWFQFEPNDWLGTASEQYLAMWGKDGYGNTIGSWNDEGGLWNINGYLIEYEAASVPEAGSTLGLLGLGLCAVGCLRSRRR